MQTLRQAVHSYTERMRQREAALLERIDPQQREAATMAADQAGDAFGRLVVLERFAQVPAARKALLGGVDVSTMLPDLEPQQKPAAPPRSTLYGLTMLDTIKSIAQLVASLGGTGLSVHWHSRPIVEAMRELPRAAHGMQAHVRPDAVGRLVWAAVDIGEVSFRAQFFEADDVPRPLLGELRAEVDKP